jgi:hypothetical protein
MEEESIDASIVDDIVDTDSHNTRQIERVINGNHVVPFQKVVSTLKQCTVYHNCALGTIGEMLDPFLSFYEAIVSKIKQ